MSAQLSTDGPFRAGGEGSGRETTNQGEARHRDLMETRRNLCPVEAAREMDSEGWRERVKPLAEGLGSSGERECKPCGRRSHANKNTCRYIVENFIHKYSTMLWFTHTTG